MAAERRAKRNMTTVHTATGKQDAEKLLNVLITAGSAGKGAFFAALQQVVENAMDAGATVFNLILDKRSKVCRMSDNGGGFGGPQIDGFHSLYVSPKEGLEGLIGRHGSGRIFLLQIGGKIVVHSVSAEFTNMIQFGLTRKDLLELLQKSSISRPINTVTPPSWWDLTGTGSVIELQDVDWKKVPTTTAIKKHFASYLRPSLARKVFVNGEPLQPRAVMGEVLEKSITVDYLPGVQVVEIYIPKTRTQRDTVRLGAYNPICPLRDFYNELPEEMASLIQSLLTRSMAGNIFMPVVNNFRAHDGRSLEGRLYQDDILPKIVRFLADEVCPIADEAFERKKERADEEERQQFLVDVAEAISPAYNLDIEDLPDPPHGDVLGDGEDDPAEPSDPEPKAPFSVSNKRITLLPGAQHVFRVTRATGTSGKFRWDPSNCGGTLDARVGNKVVYTAGMKLGKFTLTVRDKKTPAKFINITIKIVAERNMMITPIRVDISAGEEQKFSVRNTELTSGKISWELNPSSPYITLEPTSGLQVMVRVDKSATLGDYWLTAYDEEDPGETRAQSTFEVVEPPNDLANILKMEDRHYALELSTRSLPSMVERVKDARLDTRQGGGVTLDVLKIDLDHPILKSLDALHGSNEARVQALLYALATAHLQGLVEDGEEEFDEISFGDRITEIITTIMEHRVEAASTRDSD